MSGSEILEKVRDVIVGHLGVDREKVVEGASFVDDLDADSLDRVELVMALEEAFECEIPDSEAEKILTVRDAINFIASNKKAS
jgi:acyl carrier protein